MPAEGERDVIALLSEIRERRGRVVALEAELRQERHALWRAVAAANEEGATFGLLARLTGTSRQYAQRVAQRHMDAATADAAEAGEDEPARSCHTSSRTPVAAPETHRY